MAENTDNFRDAMGLDDDPTVDVAAGSIGEMMEEGILDLEGNSPHGGELGEEDKKAQEEGWSSIESKKAAEDLALELQEEGLDAEAIEKVLAGLKADDEAERAEETPEGEEGEADEQEGDGDEPEAQEDEEEAAAVEDALADMDDEASMTKVKVDGEEIDVSLAELRAGYSRTASWTRKSQALAEDRRTFVEDATDVNQRLMFASQVLRAAGVGEQHLAQLDQVYGEQAERIATHQQALKAQKIEAAKEDLPGVMGWDSPEQGRKQLPALHAFAVDYGFSADDLMSVDSPLVLKLLADAKAYHDLQSKTGSLKAKARKSKTLKPGSARRRGSSSKKARAAATSKRDALRESGSLRDAASLFAGMEDL